MSSIYGTGRYSADFQRRKVNINPATNPSIFNGDFLARYAGVITAQSL